MAELDIAPSFGAELKDGFKPVNAWVSNGIAWLDDIQQFYRDRSTIEKEYAGKLNALAKRYFEKKTRKASSLSVGDTPTVTPGSLESASMTTWTVQLTTLESRAAEHDSFATQLITNLAEPLKALAVRYEEVRKAHADYAAKLEKERDITYADLRKMKAKYDGVCQEVENRRKKIDTSYDHSKNKARSAYDQQQAEMRNAKNSYIININVTNKQKGKYYNEYVPELLDSLQDLSESRVSKLNSIWATAAQLERGTLSRSSEYLNHLASEIPRNNPVLDSMMFARHNISNWQEPPDFVFEPSPVWLDDDAIATDEASKIFLRNRLTKSKVSLKDLKSDLDKRKRGIEDIKRARQATREGKDKRDEVELVQTIFQMQENMHEVERLKVSVEVEISTITMAVGDVSIGARNHNFKSQTFKIPTNCDLCGERIWGLSARGFDCKDCGYTCHGKCELKVPADCPGEQSKEEQRKLKKERQEAAHTIATPINGSSQSDLAPEGPKLSRSDTLNSMNTLSSGFSATAHRSISGGPLTPTDEYGPDKVSTPKPKPTALRKNRILAPPPAQYIKDAPTHTAITDNSKSIEPRGKMLYSYRRNADGEINIEEGREVSILDQDDGSGWIKVRAGSDEGFVPASYVEALSSSPPSGRPGSTYSGSSVSLSSSVHAGGKKKGPPVAPKRGAKALKYVEALYDYDARSDAEHNMVGGERFVLINKDAGDGWADVEKGGQVKSVPANYIQEV